MVCHRMIYDMIEFNGGFGYRFVFAWIFLSSSYCCPHALNCVDPKVNSKYQQI